LNRRHGSPCAWLQQLNPPLFLQVLKEGHRVTVTLSDQTQDGLIVRFGVNGRAVPGGVPIHTKPGTKLRLAVQLEADEDEVAIMPFEGVVVRN
jgi:hypothetical protein